MPKIAPCGGGLQLFSFKIAVAALEVPDVISVLTIGERILPLYLPSEDPKDLCKRLMN